VRPEEVIKELLNKSRLLVPHFDANKVIHSFAGARAKSSRGYARVLSDYDTDVGVCARTHSDWIVEASSVASRMIHIAGIDSPGLVRV
jgi:hypothetical protein